MYGKRLHKLFKAVAKKLKNTWPTLRESGSEVSHFIPEHRNFRSHHITSKCQKGV